MGKPEDLVIAFSEAVDSQMRAVHRAKEDDYGWRETSFLKDDLKFDRLDLQELGVRLWEKFDVEPSVTEGVDTVGELFARVKKQINELPNLFTFIRKTEIAHG